MAVVLLPLSPVALHESLSDVAVCCMSCRVLRVVFDTVCAWVWAGGADTEWAAVLMDHLGSVPA